MSYQLISVQSSPGSNFMNATIRQTVMVSQAVDKIRLEISNAFGGTDLSISAISIARPIDQTSGSNEIEANSSTKLTFSNSESFTVPVGAIALSDAVDFHVDSQSIVTISMYLERGQDTDAITSHPGSRTTSHFVSGDHVEALHFEDSVSAEHWYFISALEGFFETTHSAIAIIGDSITDGRGSTTNGNDRWPDLFLDRLQKDISTSSLAIVNQAAGGNRVLADDLGPSVMSRVERDVVAHPGVKYAIVYEGINDIGTGAVDEASQGIIGDRLIQAYQQVISRLQRHAILVYGATMTPIGGEGQPYDHPNREATRQRVNNWIRSNDQFDAVIDFDSAVRDPDNPTQLLADYDTGDHLHLNPKGLAALADSIDIGLFTRSASNAF